MTVVMILLAGLCAVALAWWAFRRQASPALPAGKAARAPASRPPGASVPAMPRAAPDSAPALVAEPAALPEEVPPELAAFQWHRVGDLHPGQLAAMLEAIKGIPRPPHSLQKLLSPEFVAHASSIELSELVMGEPLISAKVLATVNSPMYGLQRPVTGMGQAVTFLGMSTVRNICLHYMLAEAFKPRLAISQRTFDGIWCASAIASELCVRLSKALNLPEQGALSTQVVLGFVGQLSTASLLPREALQKWAPLGRLERAQLEQKELALSAGEVGGLLMQSWGMPDALIQGVCEIDRVLVTPPADPPSPEAARSALSYLCARLGERLANGTLTGLEDYDPFSDTGPATHYLNQHLQNPALRQLASALAAPELQAAIKQALAREAAKKAA